MFGLSKLATAGIGVLILISIAAAVWFYGFNAGQNKVENDQLKTHIEQVDTARQADDKALSTIIREFHTIQEKTTEVKEVINETPPSNINPVSLRRLERVWEQQNQTRTGDTPSVESSDLR